VVCWKDGGEKDEGERRKEEDESEQSSPADSLASSFRPHPSSFQTSLRWNIAALAQERGFTNVARLASRMHAPRQSLYGIWRAETAQISLDMLGRLARTLNAEPGDWFSWVPTAEDRALIWNIQGRMQALNLTPARLGFRAELYSGSIIPIVDGIAQAVSLEALGKLARALDTPDHPFGIGDLFTWDE